MQLEQFTDEAIVLRTQKLGEADRIVVLLSRNHGKLHAAKKGARKSKTGGGGATEPFTRLDAKFSLGKNIDNILEAAVVESYGNNISADYPKFIAASQIAELADNLTPEKHIPAEQLFLLTLRALKMLDKPLPSGVSANLVALSFLMRAFALMGWEVPESVWLQFQNSEELLTSAEALEQGNWGAVAEKMSARPELEELLTKQLARFAAETLERRMKAFR